MLQHSNKVDDFEQYHMKSNVFDDSNAVHEMKSIHIEYSSSIAYQFKDENKWNTRERMKQSLKRKKRKSFEQSVAHTRFHYQINVNRTFYSYFSVGFCGKTVNRSAQRTSQSHIQILKYCDFCQNIHARNIWKRKIQSDKASKIVSSLHMLRLINPNVLRKCCGTRSYTMIDLSHLVVSFRFGRCVLIFILSHDISTDYGKFQF